MSPPSNCLRAIRELFSGLCAVLVRGEVVVVVVVVLIVVVVELVVDDDVVLLVVVSLFQFLVVRNVVEK